MNKNIEEKMNNAWGLTEVLSNQANKKTSYITEKVYDVKTIRKYIREYETMRLDDCIRQIEAIVEPMERDIKFELIDVAIEELKAIADPLIKDTPSNVFIKDAVTEGIEDLLDIKLDGLSELSKKIKEQVQLITKFNVDSSLQCIGGDSRRIMNFYIYKDDKNCKSKSKYRQFDVVCKRNVSAEDYVDLIVTNLDNKNFYSYGEIYKNVITIKDFINKVLASQFYISEIYSVIYYDTEEIFQVDEACTVSISEEDSTITIEDVGFSRILIDLKNDSYLFEELIGENLYYEKEKN